ncbi:MAG: hypothetical protein E6G72_07430 [Alphaproteobacteria bacterium]|nr:MAG: hypothetical protein E6G72_07430 [Alphaproteobacteria bacterium]
MAGRPDRLHPGLQICPLRHRRRGAGPRARRPASGRTRWPRQLRTHRSRHIARECAGAPHGTCNYCPLSRTRRKEEAVAGALRAQVPKARNEPGCLEIGAYASTRDPRRFFIHSQWLNEAAFNPHAQLRTPCRSWSRSKAHRPSVRRFAHPRDRLARPAASRLTGTARLRPIP